MDRMLAMLGEYTRKLRDVYDAFDEAPSLSKGGLIAAVLIAFGVLFVAVIAIIASSIVNLVSSTLEIARQHAPVARGSSDFLSGAIITLLVLGALNVLFYWGFKRQRRQSAREELIVHASSLARVIRAAQRMHEEGAASSFAQELALDLKIGEAEVVLRHAMKYADGRESMRIDLIVASPEPSGKRKPRRSLAITRPSGSTAST